MKKLLTALAITSALGVAVPAMAQNLPGRAYSIDQRIDAGVKNGSLTWGEARNLRSRLYNIQVTQARYYRDGLSGWEANRLSQEYDALSRAVRGQRHDNQYRYHSRANRWR